MWQAMEVQAREVKGEGGEGGGGDERDKANPIDKTGGETQRWDHDGPPLKIKINWWFFGRRPRSKRVERRETKKFQFQVFKILRRAKNETYLELHSAFNSTQTTIELGSI
jgi:hypothetical protein